MFSRIRYFLGLAALIGFLTPALAAGDPPGRVGRLSQVDGDVTFRADRQDPGGPAAINWPISSGAISVTSGMLPAMKITEPYSPTPRAKASAKPVRIAGARPGSST